MDPFERRLLEALAPTPAPSRILIAFSGGRDSSVLLHAVAALRPRLGVPVAAIHCDHGIDPQSAAWAERCHARCRALAVPLRIVRLRVAPSRGESLEMAARAARYQCFADELGAGDRLLTAHHQQDQAETLLLRLLRGSGPEGLAAIPAERPLGAGCILRPLLTTPADEIAAYGARHRLDWSEDPGNRELRHDRNFVRHRLLPLLGERWPGAVRTLARTAAACGDARDLLGGLATERLPGLTAADGTLEIAALRRENTPMQRLLVRHWLRGRGVSLPDQVHLERILGEVVDAAVDRRPEVIWNGGEVRRFAGRLYAFAGLPPLPSTGPIAWPDARPLRLPDGLGRLYAGPEPHGGIDPERWARGPREVRFRAGGERLRPAGCAHHRTLKRLFQERRIPPWLRSRLPLVYVDGTLAAIPGLCVAEELASAPGRPGIGLRWEATLSESLTASQIDGPD